MPAFSRSQYRGETPTAPRVARPTADMDTARGSGESPPKREYCAKACSGKHLKHERRDPACKLYGVPPRKVAGTVQTETMPQRGGTPKPPWSRSLWGNVRAPGTTVPQVRRNQSRPPPRRVKRTTLSGGQQRHASSADDWFVPCIGGTGRTCSSTSAAAGCLSRKRPRRRGSTSA